VHPAFSPALAPSAFYLFDKVKMALMGITFNNDGDLIQGIIGMLREGLEAVFDEWPKRLDVYVQQRQEYVE
jgi:hypothetical protein